MTAPRRVPARIAGSIEIQRRDWPPGALDDLCTRLELPNPAVVSAHRLGLALPRGTPPTVSAIAERALACGEVMIDVPRGAIRDVRECLRRHGAELHVVLNATVSPGGLGATCRAELRPHQVAALDAMRRGVQGTVTMPCGGGKTVLGIAAIAALDQPALVLVHTVDLARQWVAQVRALLGLDAGLVAQGETHVAPVTVALVQALVRLDDAALAAIGERFGLVLLDEAHHAPAITFRDLLGRLAARHRYGLTATPDRDDGLGPLMSQALGPELYRVDRAELMSAGLLRAVEVRAVETAFRREWPSPTSPPSSADPGALRRWEMREAAVRRQAYQETLVALCEDEARNAQIADIAASDAREGHGVLVLTGRVRHCSELARLIEERGAPARALTGRTSRRTREGLLDGLRAREHVLVATTQLADEGLDVPSLTRMLVVFPARARGRSAQRIGRLMRPAPGKATPVLYDLVDSGVGYDVRSGRGTRRVRPLVAMSRARHAAYAAAASGQTVLDGTDGGDV